MRVIRATSEGASVDPGLGDLARELAPLKFRSLALHDEATFRLEAGSSGRMQLPGKEWLTLEAQGETEDGKLRLTIQVPKLELKAVVAAAPGATVVVRGPEYQGATLILAVTRAAATSK